MPTMNLRSTLSVSMLPLLLLVVSTGFLLAACSSNARNEANGQNSQLNIETPVGGVHVGNPVTPEDLGIAIYPGARLKEKDSSDKSANVNISGFGFGVKMVAIEYESKDAPTKVVEFYKDQLTKYGNVLECHTSGHLDIDLMRGESGNRSRLTTCVGEKGNNIELRVGTRDNQHIVAVEPEGKGASFSLVHVQTHGRDANEQGGPL